MSIWNFNIIKKLHTKPKHTYKNPIILNNAMIWDNRIYKWIPFVDLFFIMSSRLIKSIVIKFKVVCMVHILNKIY